MSRLTNPLEIKLSKLNCDLIASIKSFTIEDSEFKTEEPIPSYERVYDKELNIKQIGEVFTKYLVINSLITDLHVYLKFSYGNTTYDDPSMIIDNGKIQIRSLSINNSDKFVIGDNKNISLNTSISQDKYPEQLRNFFNRAWTVMN